MKQSLICLILVVCVVKVIGYIQETYFITPTPSHLSSNESSPCHDLLNRSSHCSFMTLNELILGKHLASGTNSKRGRKGILVLFQSGIHVINLPKSLKAWAITFGTVRLKGNYNVTIYCKSPFVFYFTQAWYVAISNIHLKNCCAGPYRSTLLFLAQTSQNISIELQNIQIAHTRCDGIRVNLENHSGNQKAKRSRNQYFSLKNSTLSTGGNGVNIYDSGKKQRGTGTIRISNILFNGSCLSLKQKLVGKYHKYEYTVMNAHFLGALVHLHCQLTVSQMLRLVL